LVKLHCSLKEEKLYLKELEEMANEGWGDVTDVSRSGDPATGNLPMSVERQRNARLLYLFQCDLLPGITGKILEAKVKRDNDKATEVSLAFKVAGYVIWILCVMGMMFYVLLFALQQNDSRQSAWLQSFITWLVFEIVFVSSFMVIVSHIVMPFCIMGDLHKIKHKLLQNINAYRISLRRNEGGSTSSAYAVTTSTTAHGSRRKGATSVPVVFNAAKYLFLSIRVAEKYQDLKVAKIITNFSTPWPRQSYQKLEDVSKTYKKKLSQSVFNSATVILLFFLAPFLSAPQVLQDMIVQLFGTSVVCGIVVFHLNLFAISPILCALPAFGVAILAHFMIKMMNSDSRKKLHSLRDAHVKELEDESKAKERYKLPGVE
jgi:hypothetical protein